MIVGFVGLGHMGSALAANLVQRGLEVVAHDRSGSANLPSGARFVGSATELAAVAGVVVLSLPDGHASAAVVDELVTAEAGVVNDIIDTSTIGVASAHAIADRLAPVGVGYVDAPVSGGPAGARARTLSIICAAEPAARARVEPVLAALSDRRFVVGDRPGLGQAAKLANNFLSATALAATSEAVALGRSLGLDPAVLVEVLDASSGRNTATGDKFPHHVLPGTYASGFSNLLMDKDLRLYLEALAGTAASAGSEGRPVPDRLSRLVVEVWDDFAEAEPGADFTRIFAFLTGDPGSSSPA